MIATLRGTLTYTDSSYVVVECGGVGFKCATTLGTLNALPAIGNEVFLYTYMSVREDAMDLFGFLTSEELEAFKMITSVNGVGPKIGIALLSEFTANQLMLYIGSNDPKALTAASGVGIKLAQRIVLELKDKVGNVVGTISAADFAPRKQKETTASSEAVAALVSLGYTKGEASLAVGKIEGDLPVDELIKQALKLLARGL